jgi:hypothetical protein
MAFENGELRRIVDTKREREPGSWRKSYNEGLVNVTCILGGDKVRTFDSCFI